MYQMKKAQYSVAILYLRKNSKRIDEKIVLKAIFSHFWKVIENWLAFELINLTKEYREAWQLLG